jgi:hypothetical protein
MRVLSTYIRSGVKKRPVDGDLGSDAMVEPFYIWHENFITAEKFVRKGNFKGSYLDFYWFNVFGHKLAYIPPGSSFNTVLEQTC